MNQQINNLSHQKIPRKALTVESTKQKMFDLGKTKLYNRRQKKLGCSLKQKEVQKSS
jgi:hypothetical protein